GFVSLISIQCVVSVAILVVLGMAVQHQHNRLIQYIVHSIRRPPRQSAGPGVFSWLKRKLVKHRVSRSVILLGGSLRTAASVHLYPCSTSYAIAEKLRVVNCPPYLQQW